MSIGNIDRNSMPPETSSLSPHKSDYAAINAPADYALSIQLLVTNPEVQTELLARTEGQARQRYATDALTVGVMYFRQVQGRIDEQSLEKVGRDLIDRANEVVAARGIEIVSQLDGLCKQYLSDDGKLANNFQQLLRPDGDLSKAIQIYIGGDQSLLAQSLAHYIGENSEFAQLLSPEGKRSIVCHLQAEIDKKIAQQNQTILNEFSLDNKSSAINKMIHELDASQKQLHNGIGQTLEHVRREFSTDTPDSALSRLLNRVEHSNKRISDEFSSDNEQSALNRLTKILQTTSSYIQNQLTLDNQDSALNLALKQIDGTQQEILKSNSDLALNVKTALAALEARKKEQDRSPRHGQAFEDDLADLLAMYCNRKADLFQRTGTMIGLSPHCKKGDYLIELGAETAAPGALIVADAKDDKSWTERKALTEIIEAMKNRGAQVGLFIFSKQTAPANMDDFVRYGNVILTSWDPADPSTDVFVKVSLSLARALVVKEARKAEQCDDALNHIERQVRLVEKEASSLAEIQKWAQTVKTSGQKIIDKAAAGETNLLHCVEILDSQIASLLQTTEEQ